MILNELIGLERDLNLGFFQNSKLSSAEYYLNQLPSVSAFNIHSFKAKLLLLVSIDIFSSASGRGNAVGSREESQCGKRQLGGTTDRWHLFVFKVANAYRLSISQASVITYR